MATFDIATFETTYLECVFMRANVHGPFCFV